MALRTIGQKGQVVIPKRIRDRLGLKPGRKVTVELQADAVILKPEKDPARFVEDFVSAQKKLSRISLKQIKGILEEEYEIS